MILCQYSVGVKETGLTRGQELFSIRNIWIDTLCRFDGVFLRLNLSALSGSRTENSGIG